MPPSGECWEAEKGQFPECLPWFFAACRVLEGEDYCPHFKDMETEIQKEVSNIRSQASHVSLALESWGYMAVWPLQS